MTDFSQESGRAGRDGKLAESIVLLSGAWLPYGNGRGPKDTDEEFMQLYLTQQHCSRAIEPVPRCTAGLEVVHEG